MYDTPRHCERQPTIEDFLPGGLYEVPTVAAFFRVTDDTLRGWIKAGRLKTAPRPNNRSPIRIFGESVVQASGMTAKVPDAIPATKSELARRAMRAKRAAEESMTIKRKLPH